MVVLSAADGGGADDDKTTNPYSQQQQQQKMALQLLSPKYLAIGAELGERYYCIAGN